MKKILPLLLFFIPVVASSQNFQKNWEQVVTFEKEGKIKSALQEVNGIYKKANRKQNEPEIIKTFFFKSKYT